MGPKKKKKKKEGAAAGIGWASYWATSEIKVLYGHMKLPEQEVFDAETDGLTTPIRLDAAYTANNDKRH